jgi:hypothetical protein
MKCLYVLAGLSALTLAACAADDPRGSGDGSTSGREGADAAADATDALGVDLAAAGLQAGDRPCGDDAHVASIADEAGRYLAFCVSPAGDSSVFQVTPGGVAPLGAPSACALDTFLAAAPAGTAVPRALVDACKGAAAPPGRRVADAPVVATAPSFGGGVITIQGPCENSTIFVNTYCGAIDDYKDRPQIADEVSWCSSGQYVGTAQRTASSQGLPGAFEGRQTVAACGTGTTNLKGFVKGGLTGTWKVPSGANVNVSPGHVATRDVHHYDVYEEEGFDSSYGTDLRFTVTPSAGAWYRYTGAFIEFFPVP